MFTYASKLKKTNKKYLPRSYWEYWDAMEWVSPRMTIHNIPTDSTFIRNIQNYNIDGALKQSVQELACKTIIGQHYYTVVAINVSTHSGINILYHCYCKMQL